MAPSTCIPKSLAGIPELVIASGLQVSGARGEFRTPPPHPALVWGNSKLLDRSESRNLVPFPNPFSLARLTRQEKYLSLNRKVSLRCTSSSFYVRGILPKVSQNADLHRQSGRARVLSAATSTRLIRTLKTVGGYECSAYWFP